MGSVSPYETAGGRRWRVRYRTPGHAQTDKRGFKTKREAELFLASTEVSKARGEYIETSAARKTVGELGAVWLADQTHLKASALDPVQRAWRLYVEPRWGSLQLAAVKHSDVQTWVSGLSRGTAPTGHGKPPAPRSATVVLRAYGILAAVLDVAVRDRRIATNPARGVTLPRKGKKARIYLTHAQVQLVAEHAGQHATLVRLLAYTGLRWGEAVALRVRDVDALRRRVNVRENAVRVGGHIVVGTPKTHETRSVPYPAFLELAIAHECEGKPRDALVFGRGLTHLVAPDSRSGWLQTAVRAAQAVDADLPRVTPHDLRHTAASLAISAGANVKAVQRMLGHASAAMTLDTYADLFDDDLDAVATALDHARAAQSVGKMWAEQPGRASRIAVLPSV